MRASWQTRSELPRPSVKRKEAREGRGSPAFLAFSPVSRPDSATFAFIQPFPDPVPLTMPAERLARPSASNPPNRGRVLETTPRETLRRCALTVLGKRAARTHPRDQTGGAGSIKIEGRKIRGNPDQTGVSGQKRAKAGQPDLTHFPVLDREADRSVPFSSFTIPWRFSSPTGATA